MNNQRLLEALKSTYELLDIALKKEGSIDCSIRQEAREAIAEAETEHNPCGAV